MATHDDVLKDLREKNNELVQKVQYWKMTAAQREDEKLELMKEINELRLKVIRLKSGGAAEARKLDAALQSASEEALSHLVQASSAVARSMELAKAYMRDRQEMEIMSPRWSNISNSTEKVHRVPPMMIGGQSIQPVVSLSRTLNLSAQRPIARSPNSHRNVTVRAVPMHMLQDVYIPLTRIDMRDIPTNNETEQEASTADVSGENVPFDTSMEEPADESQNIANEDGYESSRRLDIVTEELELEMELEPKEEVITPSRVSPWGARADPLEGPSWLLEARREPDSTTREDAAPRLTPRATPRAAPRSPETRVFTRFSPTLRRRKRERPPESPAEPAPAPAAAPAPAPAPAPEPSATPTRDSRVLQVLVPKMRLEGASPAKRPPRFDAPSPNGATDARVVVSEELARANDTRPSLEQTRQPPADSDDNDRGDCHDSRANCHDSRANSIIHANCHDSRANGHDSRADCQRDSRRESGDSDSGAEHASEGRTRRNRKPVTYKEKPLNRKLRR